MCVSFLLIFFMKLLITKAPRSQDSFIDLEMVPISVKVIHFEKKIIIFIIHV